MITTYICKKCSKPTRVRIETCIATGISTTCSEGNSSSHTPNMRCQCKEPEEVEIKK